MLGVIRSLAAAAKMTMPVGRVLPGSDMRRRAILIVSASFVASILVAALWPGQREPEYGGKKLSEWLVLYRHALPDVLGGPPVPSREVQEALRKIGTNSLPCLMKWIAHEPVAWKERVLLTYLRLPPSARSEAVEEWLQENGGREWPLAIAGFGFLGPDAAPVVPELVRLAQASKSIEHQRFLVSCLRVIGTGARPALPYLRVLAADHRNPVSLEASFAVERIETMSTNSVSGPVAN